MRVKRKIGSKRRESLDPLVWKGNPSAAQSGPSLRYYRRLTLKLAIKTSNDVADLAECLPRGMPHKNN
jgi:hypothetical protein